METSLRITYSQLREYTRRLKIAESNKKGVNCLGTALYLAGHRDSDCHVEPSDFDDTLDGEMVRLTEPKKYSFILLFHLDTTGFTLHAGVVTGTSPLRITHRGGIDGVVVKNDTLDGFTDIGYRVPRDYGFFDIC